MKVLGFLLIMLFLSLFATIRECFLTPDAIQDKKTFMFHRRQGDGSSILEQGDGSAVTGKRAVPLSPLREVQMHGGRQGDVRQGDGSAVTDKRTVPLSPELY